VPRLLKKEDRRFSVVPVVATPGLVDSVAAAGIPVAAVSAAGSVVDCVTGLSSCGAVDESAEGSSFPGTAGAVSVAAELAASFLPNRPPNIEARLFDLGAV